MGEKKLGRGLDLLVAGDSLLAQEPPPPRDSTTISSIDVNKIRANRYQPREQITDENIEPLAESIRKDGLLQPIIVRQLIDGYELIAGERRLRAVRRAGLQQIPSIIIKKEDRDLLRLALVENLQRKDLNPIEKARGLKAMIGNYGITQDEAALIIGFNRSTIANFLRLLDLPAELLDAVSRETISMGHARALLGANQNRALQLLLLKRIVNEDLSVRMTEKIIAEKTRPPKIAPKGTESDPYIKDLENRLSGHLGTKVQIQKKKKGGALLVEYYSNEHLQSLFDRLGFTA